MCFIIICVLSAAATLIPYFCMHHTAAIIFVLIAAALLILFFCLHHTRARTAGSSNPPVIHDPPPPQRQQPSGTWTYYAKASNSTEDNRFVFRFGQVGNHWRAYIIRTPDYRGRSGARHILSDSSGQYICIAGGDPTSESVLQEKAMLWADRTLRLIRTGQDMNTT